MDVTRFDAMLAQELADPAGATYTSTMRQVAMSAAIRAYSRYKPFQRRYGTGHFYQDAAIAATTIYAVGGPYAVDTVLTLDLGMGWQEFAKVTAVDPTDLIDDLVSTSVKLTLFSPLAKAHKAGGFITQPSLGLAIIPGIDTYTMPLDFIEPELKSWDMATGNRRWVKRSESFYDGVYSQSEKIGGVSSGQSQSFGRGSSGFPGLPSNANGSLGANSVTTELQYIFIEGAPTQLQLSPAPASSKTLDFRYYAQALPQNIPDSSIDGLLAMAVAIAYENRIANMTRKGADWKEEDVAENYSSTIKALCEAAKAARDRFDVAFRLRPYLASG